MMDNGSQDGLSIRRLPEGGYVVSDIYREREWQTQHFATADIDEALAFIRSKVKPIHPAQEPASKKA